MAETLKTTNQIQIVYAANGATATDSSKGQIVFDAANQKIYVNQKEWDMKDTHLTNYLEFKVGSTSVTKFVQSADVSTTFNKGTDISLGSLSTGNIRIEHDADTLKMHIPTGGDTGHFLMWDVTNSAAKWSDVSYGGQEGTGTDASYTPVWINKGVITPFDYYIAKDVPSGAKFTDTTTSVSASGTKFTYSNIGDASFVAGTGITVSLSGTSFTIGANGKIPTTQECTNAATFNDWVNGSDVTGTVDKDGAIENWNEILAFLAGINDSSKLSQKLANKSNETHDHSVVSKTANGFVPKPGTASSIATIATQSTEWVLTTTSGGTPTWRKLPANAFDNTTYDKTYKIYGPTSNTNDTSVLVNEYALSANKATKFTYAESSDTYVVGTSGTLTLYGPSTITTASVSSLSSSKVFSSDVQKHSMYWTELT